MLRKSSFALASAIPVAALMFLPAALGAQNQARQVNARQS